MKGLIIGKQREGDFYSSLYIHCLAWLIAVALSTHCLYPGSPALFPTPSDNPPLHPPYQTCTSLPFLAKLPSHHTCFLSGQLTIVLSPIVRLPLSIQKMAPKRIGIIGYGHLGKYLAQKVKESPDLDLAFVWNRTASLVEDDLEDRYICRDLENCKKYSPDLIVEVAHPVISKESGPMFLEVADYMIGSPTALASQEIENSLRAAATRQGLYIPAGAFWGAEDILKMADEGTLQDLKVTMEKHPSCFKLHGELQQKNAQVCGEAAVTLYEGSVRGLCPLAPNNVNTMAAAAMAAHNLGFDGVKGCLIANPLLKEWHIVEVEVTGPEIAGRRFSVKTTRKNPADLGVVTGTATYASFLSSVKRAGGRGPGVHLC